MADAEELISGLGLVLSGLSIGLTIFFRPWPQPHSSLASLTSLQNDINKLKPRFSSVASKESTKQQKCRGPRTD